MRTLVVAATAAVLLATPALGETRTLDLPPFTALDISSGIDAKVTVGPAQSVLLEAADAGLLEEVQIRVEDGVLRAWIDWSIFDLFSAGERDVTLTIEVPALGAVEASAGADVTAEGISGQELSFSASSGADLSVTGVAGGNIRIDVSSGAGARLTGTCTSARFSVSSGADIHAEALHCETVDADASSGAHAEVFAAKSVKAEASSGAGIVVHGNPSSMAQETSSGGDVRLVN